MSGSLEEEVAELRAALELRDRQLSMVVHDLRTQLNTIALAGSVLDSAAMRGEVPPATIATWARRISTGVGRLQRQIDELLDVSALDLATSLPIDRAPTDLVELARGCIDDLGRAGGAAKRIRLEHDHLEVIGDWDRARIQRLVDNLLSNALKYGCDGEIVVQLSGAAATEAVLTVSDRGIGIPAAELPLVFDRFFRGSNVGPDRRGTGIGLSSARYVVERHGGTILIDSREGAGTSVTVRLPR